MERGPRLEPGGISALLARPKRVACSLLLGLEAWCFELRFRAAVIVVRSDVAFPPLKVYLLCHYDELLLILFY